MRLACKNLSEKAEKSASHSGLVLHKYVDILKIKESKESKESEEINERQKFLGRIKEALDQVEPLYKTIFARHEKTMQSAYTKYLKTTDRVIVGFGQASVLEVNVALHHMYGTPIVPGAALKGLAASYCHEIWGEQNSEFREGGKYYNTMFGSKDSAGHLIFHDAWITPNTLKESLNDDIMTVHHQSYYNGQGAPTDYDSPNPIAFLSVKGTFLIAIDCDVIDENGEKWRSFGMKLLAQALKDWGIGSKTRSGYGRFQVIDR